MVFEKLEQFFPPHTIGSREHWNEVFDAGPVTLQMMLFSLHVRRAILLTPAELELADRLIQELCERLWSLGYAPGQISDRSAELIAKAWQGCPTRIYTDILPRFEQLYGPLSRDAISILMQNAPENIYTSVHQHLDYESRVCLALKHQRFEIAEGWLRTAHVWSQNGLRHFCDNVVYHANAQCDKFVRLLVEQGNSVRDIINAMSFYRTARQMSVMDMKFFRDYDGTLFPPGTLIMWMVDLHQAGLIDRLVFLAKWTDAATFDFFLTSIRATPRVTLGLLFQIISHHRPSRVRHLCHRPEWPDAQLMWIRACAMRRRITARLPKEIETLIWGAFCPP